MASVPAFVVVRPLFDRRACKNTLVPVQGRHFEKLTVPEPLCAVGHEVGLVDTLTHVGSVGKIESRLSAGNFAEDFECGGCLYLRRARSVIQWLSFCSCRNSLCRNSLCGNCG